MSDLNHRLREIGAGLRSLVDGFTNVEDSRGRTAIPTEPPRIKLGQDSLRSARLFTEIVVGGQKYDINATGVRSCRTIDRTYQVARGTEVYALTCSVTYFAAEDTPLGPVKIIQDPRVQTKGWILLRRNQEGEYEWPALSFFNQHLIFQVGNQFFYYPRAWQVVSAISAWPPEFHQYHHLEDDTPVFDFLTNTPNVARKGISTISIEGKLSPEEEARILEEHRAQIEVVRALPPSKMVPLELTPAQGEPQR